MSDVRRGRDGEPAEAAELGRGEVLADGPAELVDVEGEGLVLIVDPELCVGEGVHGEQITAAVARLSSRIVRTCVGGGGWGVAGAVCEGVWVRSGRRRRVAPVRGRKMWEPAGVLPTLACEARGARREARGASAGARREARGAARGRRFPRRVRLCGRGRSAAGERAASRVKERRQRRHRAAARWAPVARRCIVGASVRAGELKVRRGEATSSLTARQPRLRDRRLARRGRRERAQASDRQRRRGFRGARAQLWVGARRRDTPGSRWAAPGAAGHGRGGRTRGGVLRSR